MAPREYIEIGPTPAAEPCAQVGAPDYDPDQAKAECRRFIQVIRQKLGKEPDGAELTFRSFPHDFGRYYEVVCYFQPGNETAVEYAFNVEANAPATWEDTHA